MFSVDRGEDLVRLLEKISSSSASISSVLACDNSIVSADGAGRSACCGLSEAIACSSCGAAASPLEDGKHGFGLFCERRIGHQVGIVLQSRQVALEFFAQLAVFRLRLQASSNARASTFCCSTSCSTETLNSSSGTSWSSPAGRPDGLHSPRELGEVVGAVFAWHR